MTERSRAAHEFCASILDANNLHNSMIDLINEYVVTRWPPGDPEISKIVLTAMSVVAVEMREKVDPMFVKKLAVLLVQHEK